LASDPETRREIISTYEVILDNTDDEIRKEVGILLKTYRQESLRVGS